MASVAPAPAAEEKKNDGEKLVLKSAGQALQVAVRVRPLSQKELGQNDTNCVAVTPDGKQITVKTGSGARDADKTFAFDHVFGENSGHQEIFDKLVIGLVQNVIDGDPASIFCYGQVCVQVFLIK